VQMQLRILLKSRSESRGATSRGVALHITIGSLGFLLSTWSQNIELGSASGLMNRANKAAVSSRDRSVILSSITLSSSSSSKAIASEISPRRVTSKAISFSRFCRVDRNMVRLMPDKFFTRMLDSFSEKQVQAIALKESTDDSAFSI